MILARYLQLQISYNVLHLDVADLAEYFNLAHWTIGVQWQGIADLAEVVAHAAHMDGRPEVLVALSALEALLDRLRDGRQMVGGLVGLLRHGVDNLIRCDVASF